MLSIIPFSCYDYNQGQLLPFYKLRAFTRSAVAFIHFLHLTHPTSYTMKNFCFYRVSQEKLLWKSFLISSELAFAASIALYFFIVFADNCNNANILMWFTHARTYQDNYTHITFNSHFRYLIEQTKNVVRCVFQQNKTSKIYMCVFCIQSVFLQEYIIS